MQGKIKAALLLSLASMNATAAEGNYVGVDYIHRVMMGRDRYAYAMRLVLPESYNGFQVYAAHRFDNDVGLSLGWEQSSISRQNHTFAANETFLGDTQSAGDRTSVSSRVQAINLDVTGYFDFFGSFEAVGSLGFALIRADMTGSTYAAGITRNMSPSRNFDNLIPRIGAALQYFTKYNIGMRIFGVWEGTNVYHMRFTDEDGLRLNIKPFKQSWQFGLGIVGKFKL